jgi:hypothetical protein
MPDPGRRRRAPLLVLALSVVALAACAHQPGVGPYIEAPGFLHGLLHGLVAPFAFVGSFFTDVRMYAWPNRGVWYDLGFVLGIGVWGGAARKA